MENVVYEEELVREEVYRGTLILDGNMNEKQQRKHIFDMMRNEGIPVLRDNEYDITYEGADDNEGLSETQTTEFVVTHSYKKQVPYLVKREEVYSGDYILDGTNKTPEEQRKHILEMMESAGVDTSRPEELEIGYEGAEDNEGLSETQQTRFVVTRVTKEKITDSNKFLISSDLSEEDAMKKIYDELVSLKEKITNTNNASEVASLAEKIGAVSETLDDLVDKSTRNYESFEHALTELDEQIKTMEEELQANVNAYKDSYQKIKELMTANEDSAELLEKKISENDISLSIKKKIDEETKALAELKKKRRFIQKDLDTAKALGLSAKEYIEIIKTNRKKNLINAILETKGLTEVVSKPAKERTPEERRMLKEAKAEILNEMLLAKKENEEASILNIIESLYGIETEVKLRGKQRVLIVKQSALDNIKENATKLPQKIVNREEQRDYEASPAPRDMVETMNKTAITETKPKEIVTFYVDINAQNRVYVGEKTVQRFNLTPVSNDKVKLNGELCYEINQEAVRFISENENNSYAPYTVRYENVELDRTNGLQEQFTFFIDTAEPEVIYARQYIFERFNLPASEEVRINGEVCFPIPRDDVRNIVVNSNNELSPYKVRFDGVTFEEEKIQEVTEEQQEEVEQREEKNIETIVIYKDEETGKQYVTKPVFDRFNIDSHGLPIMAEGKACFEISDEDAKYINNNANNNYSPYKVEYRTVKVQRITNSQELNNFNPDESVDKYTIFRDIDTNKLYVRKPVFDRFHSKARGQEVKIKGIAGYEITREDAEFILGNANNSYSPYVVDYVNLRINKENKEEIEEPQKEETNIEENINSTAIVPAETKELVPVENKEIKDLVTIYRDIQSERLFANRSVFDRFNIEDSPTEVNIDGNSCFELNQTDADFIINNANNNYSPYRVEVRNVPLGLTNEPQEEKEEQVEEPRREIPEEYIAPRGLDQKFTLFRDIQSGRIFARKNVFERFNLNEASTEVRIDGALCYEVNPEDVDFITNNANNSYSPYIVRFEKLPLGLDIIPREEVKPKEEETPKEQTSPGTMSRPKESLENRGLTERITLYRDLDNNVIYAKGSVLTRFNLDATTDPVRIEGPLCFGIREEDATMIERNANNNYSPYIVEYRDIHLGKKDVEEERVREEVPNPQVLYGPAPKQQAIEKTLEDDENLKNRELKEKIVLYRDLDNNIIYAKKSVLARFNLDATTDPVRIEGPLCFGIREEDATMIERNANNNYSPYIVEYRDIHLGKKEEEEEVITLYRDTIDNQVYASEEVLRRFGISPASDGIMIEGLECHKISRDTDQIINSIANMSHDPKLIIKYIDITLEKSHIKPKPHVEYILDKLTDGLDIRARDSNHYKASNLKIAKSFKQELKSGNVAYNIVHIIPATIKAGISFFRKLSGKIMTTKRAKATMREIEQRLAELSEEELEVLFDEYKGSQLKTDMNNQINPLILDTIRDYGLRKVAALNDTIRINYGELFSLLGQIKALEEKLADDNLSKAQITAYNDERKRLIEKAATNVRIIIDARRKGNNLLSSGVHGIEEDFKAVSTKLSYVGLRFTKTNDFDNELQHLLGEYGRSLNESLASNNAEGIVQNFMGLETCYYKNTEVRRSIVGRRSVGSKYYTPVAEQFDYRDDPFVRDLLTTVAVTSATVSAINAYRVHQIESQNYGQKYDQLQQEYERTVRYVNKQGNDIADKRIDFQAGMEAQARQDVLGNANASERAHFDSTANPDWTFSSAYRAADDAGHIAFNQFNDQVQSSINQVVSDYSQGLISQAQALEKMAQISTSAQASYHALVNTYLKVTKDYATAHPQYDLSAVVESMEYMSAHPDAIARMNEGMVDVANIGDSLASLQAVNLGPLGDLPSDMATTLIAAASATVLAMNVANSMSGKNRTRDPYSEEISHMMEDYVIDNDLEDTNSRTK